MDDLHLPYTHEDYTIGWVCALPKEQSAAIFMLEERHEDLPNPSGDHNAYTLGSIGKHKVVIAGLPKGRVGIHSAATAATRMVSTFPNIRVGLMVGIGGGIPQRLGLEMLSSVAPVEQSRALSSGIWERPKPMASLNEQGPWLLHQRPYSQH